MPDTVVSVLLIGAGLALILLSAERLVKGVVGTSLGFGVSAFLISTVFIGFDPENLAVGAVGAYEGRSGIAMGSIVGAAMVAIALALGITALLTPVRFAQVPWQALAAPLAAVLLTWLLVLDGELGRSDGAILLAGFVAAVVYLGFLSRRGIDVRAGGEVAEVLEESEDPRTGRWRLFGLMLATLAGIIAGSELLVTGSEEIIDVLGVTETVYGVTVLAFLVSIEELARELPAARQGRTDITLGNVVGSVLAFFLMNAGIIALVRPVEVADEVRWFYFPVALGTLVLLSAALIRFRSIHKAVGGLLVASYAIFFKGGYFW